MPPHGHAKLAPARGAHTAAHSTSHCHACNCGCSWCRGSALVGLMAGSRSDSSSATGADATRRAGRTGAHGESLVHTLHGTGIFLGRCGGLGGCQRERCAAAELLHVVRGCALHAQADLAGVQPVGRADLKAKGASEQPARLRRSGYQRKRKSRATMGCSGKCKVALCMHELLKLGPCLHLKFDKQ